MALIDEYKQAIQDVLDGRMKEAPRPSELPWTEDKAATMWAAAAAELIAEDSSVVVIPVTYASFHLHLDASYNDILGYLAEGKAIFATLDGTQGAGVGQWMFANTATGGGSYIANFISYSSGVSVTSFTASSATEKLSA